MDSTLFLQLIDGRKNVAYMIDKIGSALVVSPMRAAAMTQNFEPLAICLPNGEEICTLNFGEVFISAIYDALEHNQVHGDSNMIDKLAERQVTAQELYDSYQQGKIIFREFEKCVTSDKQYKPPSADEVMAELNLAENYRKIINMATKKEEVDFSKMENFAETFERMADD